MSGDGEHPASLGRPTSATWIDKDTGDKGSIKFDYLVDASGRAGLMSTKYLKNRKFNSSDLYKSVATWGYWTGHVMFGKGTKSEGAPFFEALADGSGWVWFIPLHTGQVSVGVVQQQHVQSKKKRDLGLGSQGLYIDAIRQTPGISALLPEGGAELVGPLRSASDWSYTASTYATPFVRIVGDAGCFIDPFFSSGVHLAIASALSAATTICASIKAQVSEVQAGSWHTKRVEESYTRFLLVVSSALMQIRAGEEPVIADFGEQSFDRAFRHFRPVIQGQADVQDSKVTPSELSEMVKFCFTQGHVMVDPKEKQDLIDKIYTMAGMGEDSGKELTDEEFGKAAAQLENTLAPEQLEVLRTIRARRMLHLDDWCDIHNIGTDVIDGFCPSLVTGQLGLVKPSEVKEKKTPKTRDHDLIANGLGEGGRNEA